jgi:hypothetical protein
MKSVDFIIEVSLSYCTKGAFIAVQMIVVKLTENFQKMASLRVNCGKEFVLNVF